MYQVILRSEMPSARVVRIAAYVTNNEGHHGTEEVAYVHSQDGVIIQAGREETVYGRLGMEAIELSMKLAVKS